jgi:hypothetical protein
MGFRDAFLNYKPATLKVDFPDLSESATVRELMTDEVDEYRKRFAAQGAKAAIAYILSKAVINEKGEPEFTADDATLIANSPQSHRNTTKLTDAIFKLTGFGEVEKVREEKKPDGSNSPQTVAG